MHNLLCRLLGYSKVFVGRTDNRHVLTIYKLFSYIVNVIKFDNGGSIQDTPLIVLTIYLRGKYLKNGCQKKRWAPYERWKCTTPSVKLTTPSFIIHFCSYICAGVCRHLAFRHFIQISDCYLNIRINGISKSLLRYSGKLI